MIESSQGGAEAVSSEFQLYRILCFARAKGGARASCPLNPPLPSTNGTTSTRTSHTWSSFDTVGVDFAGPIKTKYGHVRKPVIVKSYVCLFVCLSIKAVHLEPVSDLTSDAFIAALRRFIARRGKPRLIMSNHGTNFVGANRELQEMYDILGHQKITSEVSDFCSTQGIQWKFIPERAPHFGGLWEAAVKSMKFHFKRVVGETKLTFEELTTVLAQIECC